MKERKQRRDKGAALLLVIAIIAFLTVSVVEFQREARVEQNYADNILASIEAQAMVRSGAAAGLAMMRALGTADIDRAGLWYSEQGHLIPIGQSTVLVSIEDAEGKFPIGALVDSNGKVVTNVYEAYKRLIDALEIEDSTPEELAGALVDWIDSDASGDYEFNENFTVPDSVPKHLDELGRIKGYDKLPKYALDRIIAHLDTRTGKSVNVNTAPAPVLFALNKNYVDLPDAQADYDLFTTTPATSADLAGLFPRRDRYLEPKISSTRLQVRIEADVRGVRAKADAVFAHNKKSGVYQIVDWTQL
jgi:type II secretory pathway component PulK